MVSLELRIRGGQLFENMENLGISYLTANMLDAGTLSRTKQALEKDIAVIGADIEIDATATEIIIYASGLAEHYEKLMAIISEMILQPAFEPSEFEFLIHRTKEHIKARQASTEDIAHLEFKNCYGAPIMCSHKMCWERCPHCKKYLWKTLRGITTNILLRPIRY